MESKCTRDLQWNKLSDRDLRKVGPHRERPEMENGGEARGLSFYRSGGHLKRYKVQKEGVFLQVVKISVTKKEGLYIHSVGQQMLIEQLQCSQHCRGLVGALTGSRCEDLVMVGLESHASEFKFSP
jgi:hypothetical protein